MNDHDAPASNNFIKARATLQGYLISLAAFFIIIAGLRAAKSLVVTVLLSGFIGILLTPVLRWLRARRVPTPMALLLIIAFVAIIGGGVVAVVGQSTNELLARLPFYQQRLNAERGRFERIVQEQKWLERLLPQKDDDSPETPTDANTSTDTTSPTDTNSSKSIESQPTGSPEGQPSSPSAEAADPPTRAEPIAPTDSEKASGATPDHPPRDPIAYDPSGGIDQNNDSESIVPSHVEGLHEQASLPTQPPTGLVDQITTPTRSPNLAEENDVGLANLFSFEPDDAIALMKRLLAELGGIFSSALLILITVIFILLEASRLPDKLRAAFGKTDDDTRDHIGEIVNNIRRYMLIKTGTSMLTGGLIAAFLTAYDIRYALLWGLLAFLFNYVPNIGSIIASAPAIALALVERGMTPAIVVAIAYLAVNCLISYGIEPRFMGRGLGLSTLVVFLSLLFWGWVLGPIGMLLSAPLTMIMKIILANHEDTRWIALMLGSKAPQEEPI